MKVPIEKEVMLGLFLLSRFLVKIAKKIDKKKTIMFSVITLLCKKPYTVSELAKLFFVPQTFMSMILSKMEDQGIVGKKAGKDLRKRSVFLTEKGLQLREANQNAGCTACDILFKNMTAKEIERLGKLVGKINMDYKGLMKNVNFVSRGK